MNGGPIVGIIGTGLIGGSVALRARHQGARTIGYDEDAAALSAALQAGAIEEAVSRDDLYARSNMVVIATYLDATVVEIERLRAQPPVCAELIVDVASVKVPVCAAAAALPHFVATHPMAGSERRGATAARADLFDGRTWAYVPSGDPLLDERASAFIMSQGASPLAVAAHEHDRIVAFTSHVPQLVAWAYVRQAGHHAGETFDRLTGATARELLRVGASGAAMWRDVLRANGAHVEPELRALARALLEVADHMTEGDVEAVLPP